MIESGNAVDVIYTDFSNAFDSVLHQRLLKKMESLGITGNTLSWVKAFLSNRQQCVRVDDTLSNWISVISGIPQGSVLGPILFVIFINDMPEMVKSMCQLFADDAKLFRSVDLRDETSNLTLQEDLEILHHWSEKWQLPFNTGKCKVLHLGHNNESLNGVPGTRDIWPNGPRDQGPLHSGPGPMAEFGLGPGTITLGTRTNG